MKKSIFIVILIVLLAGTGMPFINGLVMEKIIHNSTDNINQMYEDSGSDLKLEIQQYDRGFSRSIIEWKIDFGLLSNIYGIDEILFIEEAKHGYKGVVSQTRLDKNQWFADFVETKLGGKNPLYIETVYPLKGDIISTFVMDSFSLDDGGNFKGKIEPARLSFSMDKAFKKIGSSFTWKGCEVPGKLTITDIEFKTRMERISTQIWVGKTSFNLADFQAKDSGEEVDLKKLKMESDVNFDSQKNSLSASLGMGIGVLSEHGNDTLKDAFVRIGINQIDATGYERLVKMYASMINDMMKVMGEKGFDPNKMEKIFQRQAAAQGFQIMAEAEKLLKKGFEIKVSELNVHLPQGKIEGDLSLGLKKDMTMAGFVPIMMQPKLAIDIFSLDTRLSLPVGLVGNNPNLVRPVYPGMQTGLFIKDGDVLTHTARIQDGKLIMNQKEVVLE